MNRFLGMFLLLCAATGVLFGTPAWASRVSGLTQALKQLSPEELQQVLQGLGVAIVPIVPAPVPTTGQTTIYAYGDDGDLTRGVPWPTPRFTDKSNGTVTDNLTGLIWAKNANMFQGRLEWQIGGAYPAIEACATLNSGEHNLTDGSVEGDWRLPNIRELQSVVDYGTVGPALPEGHPFVDVALDYYWSSNTFEYDGTWAWFVYMGDGVAGADHKYLDSRVWCVRGGE